MLARKILFYFFLIIYLVICPLVVLYALGYLFYPLKKGITQTGVLYVSSEPAGASIYLGKSRYTQNTPTAIPELLPGKYSLRLGSKGYKPWLRTVTIDPGEATVFERVLLIPKKWEAKELFPGSFEQIFALGAKDYLILNKGQILGDYLAYDLRRKIITPLAPKASALSSFPVSSIFSVAPSRAMIVYGGSFLERRYLYLKLKNGKTDFLDITKLIPRSPELITWNVFDDTNIFTLHGNTLNRIDIEASAYFPDYIEDIRGFGLSGKWIYVLDKDNNLLRYSYDKQDSNVLPERGLLGKKLFDRKDIYRIEVLSDDSILFLGRNGRLFSRIAPYEIVKQAVVGITVHKRGGAALFWTREYIGVIEFIKQRDDSLPEISRPNARIKKVYTKGRQITKCLWAYDASYILFQDGENLFLLDLMPQGENYAEKIAGLKKDTSFYYSEEHGEAYFLSQTAGRLTAIKIIPQ